MEEFSDGLPSGPPRPVMEDSAVSWYERFVKCISIILVWILGSHLYQF